MFICPELLWSLPRFLDLTPSMSATAPLYIRRICLDAPPPFVCIMYVGLERIAELRLTQRLRSHPVMDGAHWRSLFLLTFLRSDKVRMARQRGRTDGQRAEQREREVYGGGGGEGC